MGKTYKWEELTRINTDKMDKKIRLTSENQRLI